jgi:hypothetical protein
MEEIMKRAAKKSLLSGLLWTVLSLTASAQVATTGQLVGAVQDQSGAVVPGIELRLQNEDTRAVLTATASADGGFVFPTLLPGSYTLTVSITAPNFGRTATTVAGSTAGGAGGTAGTGARLVQFRLRFTF